MDSLDDVKNHTYNELFVSGGFIVSDEFVLNPDLITQGRSDSAKAYSDRELSPVAVSVGFPDTDPQQHWKPLSLNLIISCFASSRCKVLLMKNKTLYFQNN